MRIGLIIVIVISGLLGTLPSHAQIPSNCVIDAVLLIDSAGSLATDDFEQIKALANGIVASLPMGNARVGVIQFADNAETRIGLTGDAGAVSGAISGMSGIGGAADFRVALDAGEVLLAESRPFVARALVLITDGISATDARDRSAFIRANNIGIVTVGIGTGIARRELFRLASPSYSDIFAVFPADFQRAPASAGVVSRSICATSAIIGGRVAVRTYDARRYQIILNAADVPVNLYAQDGQLVQSTRTDTSGNYRFYVGAGVYRVQVELAGGATYAPGNDGSVGVTATPGYVNTRAYTLLQLLD